MVFGGGTVLEANGNVRLHQASIDRAERTIDYYNTNKELFVGKILAHKAFILCTGGYGLLSAGIEERDACDREAVLMANYLIGKGHIPKEIILLEQESTSTLTNWTRSLDLYPDELDAGLFSQTEQLGLVSHPCHLERVVYLAEKLGYSRDFLERIPTVQTDSQNYESHVLAAYKEYLGDTEDPLDMEERERSLAKDTTLIAYLKSLL